MKKIKLFFLAFLSVCLGLTSFSNAIDLNQDAITYLDNRALNSGSFSNAVLPVLYENPNPNSSNVKNLCVVFKNFSRTSDFAWNLRIQDTTNYQANNLLFYATSTPYSLYCVSGRRKTLYISVNNISNKISAEKFRVIDYSVLLSLLDNPSQFTACKNENSVLSGSLSSCQSDLSSCRGGQDASLLACIDQKEQCESSLSTLSGNYASLENMNSSLSSQLQECLENASDSTGDLICNKFDLFWTSDNTNYSFPIKNDLILPPGYKGFVNEGVLAIKQDSSLDSAFSIDDEDFQGVVSDFGKVFVFIFSGGLFVLFLFIIRKYFTSLFK